MQVVLGLLLLASAALGGGCSASPKASRDAGTDCVDAGDGWCRVPCKRSVADYCAGVAQAGGACVTQWPADPGDFCSLYPPDGFFILDDSVADSCGGYRVFSLGQVESTGSIYYSMQTGKLLAVFGGDPVSHTLSHLPPLQRSRANARGRRCAREIS